MNERKYRFSDERLNEWLNAKLPWSMCNDETIDLCNDLRDARDEIARLEKQIAQWRAERDAWKRSSDDWHQLYETYKKTVAEVFHA